MSRPRKTPDTVIEPTAIEPFVAALRGVNREMFDANDQPLACACARVDARLARLVADPDVLCAGRGFLECPRVDVTRRLVRIVFALRSVVREFESLGYSGTASRLYDELDELVVQA